MPTSTSFQRRQLQEIKNTTEETGGPGFDNLDYSKMLDVNSYEALQMLTEYEAASDIFN